MIGSVCLKLNDRIRISIYSVGNYDKINWNAPGESELGADFCVFKYSDADRRDHSISVVKGLDESYILRVIETRRYILRIDREDDITDVSVNFLNEENRLLKIDRDKDTVTFQFINYLGRSKIHFKFGGQQITLPFEVVPDKMDYEDDYIALTESLAEHCAALLIEYSGATSSIFGHSVESTENLLEQFIFLRQFCYSQNLQGIFESVRRNPDRILRQEEVLKPFGAGMPSGKFYTCPFSSGRKWTAMAGASGYLPAEITVTRKYDSFDTPANRFIHYALQRFDDICVGLTIALDPKEKNMQAECYREAVAIHKILDDLLRSSFFDEVGPLDIMPQNNQVLQKREGYSQIYSAWSMLDLALQLDWKGKDNVYEGESKNIALLYEYWLFFELYRIIRSINGCEPVKTDENPFIQTDDGITISLRETEKSCQSFELKDQHVKINLYYNRTFSSRHFESTLYEGSYSRPFRPDYTLAIYPDTYKGRLNGEDEAVKDGTASFVHFDAKYRITELTSLVGKSTDFAEEDEVLAEDKTGSIINTYKRGDLLKMHTYNDAIRRTVGSYVLYPGSAGSGKGNETFQLYDEILPGVGAFSMKPSIVALGENELRNFIVSLIRTKEAEYSRLNRMSYYREIVLNEPSAADGPHQSLFSPYAKKENKFVLGYLRADNADDYYWVLKNNGYLNIGKEFLFYFYAIKGKNVYSHHKEVFRVPYFRFYKNDIQKTRSYEIEPYLCRILSNELLSREALTDKLNALGIQSGNKHNSDFYYVLTLRVENDTCPLCVISRRDVDAQNGNDTFSPHSPKIISSIEF